MEADRNLVRQTGKNRKEFCCQFPSFCTQLLTLPSKQSLKHKTSSIYSKKVKVLLQLEAGSESSFSETYLTLAVKLKPSLTTMLIQCQWQKLCLFMVISTGNTVHWLLTVQWRWRICFWFSSWRNHCWSCQIFCDW